MARADWKRPTHFPLKEGYRRIKVTISYDGTHFSGWQKQQSERSVQGEIEHALCNMLKEPVPVYGSARTDAGVHALGQVAHFDTTNTSVPIEAFPLALNALLPPDIRIVDSGLANERFHARFTSISREYCYMIKSYDDYTPFDHNRVCRVRSLVSLELLNEYASYIVGTHNFSTFCASKEQGKSRVRDIYTSIFSLKDSQWGGKMLVYTISGNAFLMHQVRSLVGTMLKLAAQRESPAEFKRRLESHDRRQAGPTAPACGLYLMRIAYDPY